VTRSVRPPTGQRVKTHAEEKSMFVPKGIHSLLIKINPEPSNSNTSARWENDTAPWSVICRDNSLTEVWPSCSLTGTKV